MFAVKNPRAYLCAGCAAAALIAPAQAAAPIVDDEIIVTASPIERPENETIIGVSTIFGDELKRNLANSIGETLRREPGVSSTFFGPGASRPVIRGLGGDRIRVLDNGIGSIDASATSPDHAVAVEPATAERIEIIRGVSTLLYGSSAAGGVVNVFDGRIPRKAPEDGLSGALRIGGSTVDDGVETAGGFNVDLGDLGGAALVFHGDGFYRNAESYEIPGFAESEILREAEEAEEMGPHDDDDHDEEEEVFGLAENSQFETKGGSAGLSLVFDNGHFGVSGTAIDTVYGVPGGHEHEHEEGEEEDAEEEGEEEGGVTIDLRQRRLDLSGDITGRFLLFQRAKIRLGYADYTHTEIEPSGEPGTVFDNEGWEGRVELIDQTRSLFGGDLDGALGFQFRLRDFSAIGEEAFVPPTESEQYGVFAVKELTTGPWRLELGGRYEKTSHDVTDGSASRDFNAFSVSAGAGVKPSDLVFFGVTGFRTERAPSTEELFSNGPHLATNAFEVGDPDLDLETARGVEATLKIGNERAAFTVNGFYTSYKDFIYETETGEEEDGLPVFQFVAEDATFRGFEAQVEAELFQLGGFDIHGDAAVDYVRATVDTGGNENLPRIPPLTGLFGLEANSERLDLRAEVEYAARQDDTATFELPTDDYTLFNAYMTFRIIPGDTGLAFRVAGRNLTNEDARLHTSFLKDVAPLPGRNISLSLIGEF